MENSNQNHNGSNYSGDMVNFVKNIHVSLIIFLPLVGIIIAVNHLYVGPFHYSYMILLIITYILSSLGITVGYHRLFTHRSFKCRRWVKIIMAVLGSCAGQGPIIYWVALHRKHHQYSDQDLDPHSPIHRKNKLEAFIYSQWGWMYKHKTPNTIRYAPDLMKDKSIRWINNHYSFIMISGLILPSIIFLLIFNSVSSALYAFIWGGLVRLFFSGNFTWSINSISHMFGTQRFKTNDESTNNLLLSIPTLGESWHNNHHAFPYSAKHGMKWWEVDISYYFIAILRGLSLAWDVKEVNKDQLQSKKIIQN